MPLTKEEIGEIAERTADKVMERMRQQREERELRDFIIGGAMGEGAIPVYGRETKKLPCHGCRIDLSKPLEPGNVMVTTENAFGTLAPDEVRNWCSEIIETPDGRCARVRSIREAAKKCKELHPSDTEAFFKCYAPAWGAASGHRELSAHETHHSPRNPQEAVFVEKLPKCDFCDKPALYDGRTIMGPWAHMCEEHFKMYGVGLGVGKGQKLVARKALAEAEKIRMPEYEEQSVTMTEDDLETATLEDLWYPICPYCGAETPAEPDAHAVYCQACNRRFKIINPFFSNPKIFVPKAI